MGTVPAFVLQLRQEKVNGEWPALDEGKVRLRLEDRTMLVAKLAYIAKVDQKHTDLKEKYLPTSQKKVFVEKMESAQPLLSGEISIDADLTLEGLGDVIDGIKDFILKPGSIEFPHEQSRGSGAHPDQLADDSICVENMFNDETEVEQVQSALSAAADGASSGAAARPKKKAKTAKKASRRSPAAYPGICAKHRIRQEKMAFFKRDGAILKVIVEDDLTWQRLYDKGWRTAIV